MKTSISIVVAILVIVAAVMILRSRGRRMRHGEILPANEMQEKYGLYAENRPDIKIDPMQVPENLCDLIPMAEKWGVGDDIISSDIEEKASDTEKEAFRAKLKGRTKQVTDWLDSYGAEQPMPEEAAHFMYMLESLDETGLWPDSPKGT
jgi:hypothetical protein